MHLKSIAVSFLVFGIISCGGSHAPSTPLPIAPQSKAQSGAPALDAALNVKSPSVASLQSPHWRLFPATYEPTFFVADRSGDLWFTETNTSAIGEVTNDGTFTSYSVGQIAGDNLNFGPRGDLWFAASTSIDSFDPNSQTITQYSMNGHATDLNFVASGTQGDVWFTATEVPPLIGRISSDGHVSLFSLAGMNIKPVAMTLGPDGNMWFTARGNGKVPAVVGSITRSGQITTYPLDKGSDPGAITVGPDQNLWIADGKGKMLMVTTSGVVTPYALPHGFPDTTQIARAHGQLWVAGALPEGYYGLASITTSGTVTVYKGPFRLECCGSALVQGPDGNVWFASGNDVGDFVDPQPTSSPAAGI